MKNFAIILAAGSGTRFGGDLPKQFTKLAGRMIIEHTVDVFHDAPRIDEIHIVTQDEHIAQVWDLIKSNGWTKVTKVVHGGNTRMDSTRSALQALAQEPPDSKVLFHDAVRPLVDGRIIDDCLNALDQFDAVDVVIPSADTLVRVADDESIDNIPNRTSMRRGQTPQAFKLDCIQAAYQKAAQQRRDSFTCDCGVVRATLPNVKIMTVQGSEKNVKVTQPIDLFLAEKLLQAGLDVDPSDDPGTGKISGKNLVIFGGASGIGLEIKHVALAVGARVEVASRRFNGVDIRKLADVRAFLDTARARLGQIDYIVNTAGFLIKKPIDWLEESEISELIDTNYTGAINVAIAAKPHLLLSKGMLLNFTSSSYTRGRPLYTIYSSANAAIVNLTQGLAAEWAPDGIRVNCINPERTNTPMRQANFGIEPPELLLDAETVARASIRTLTSHLTGAIVDVRKDGR
ncbi:2-C-methyl-D-erythritol 4-phosphate cytidylyltransferase [Castellaniella sp.]|uniref:2-C-methyl-D-erythritol 4-phosphate cytidylyltransferase n=1 Tax=Castellaniella sp. TaxID=1955812 RepID=UPI002AFEFEA9|nr:2-C-methyl-D-erythritol 4-phosphate cytidylyltransferase [Castellaniella sp.]